MFVKNARLFAQSEPFQRLIETALVLVDVGARGGIHPRWKDIPKLKVIGFEPDVEECERLNKRLGRSQRFLPVALSNKKGKVLIHITRNPACSSVLEPNVDLVRRFKDAESYDVVKSVQVCCESLDQVVRENGIDDIDFLKLDTQGSELEILEGAKENLKYSIFGVEIEMEFQALYKKQALFSEVDNYLRGFGFTPFDYELARSPRAKYLNVHSKQQVLWTHAIYLKDYCQVSDGSIQLNRTKALKAIALAEICGFPDYALELTDFFSERILSPTLCSEISKLIYVAHRNLSPELRLVDEIYRSFNIYVHRRMPSIYNRLRSIKNPAMKRNAF